MWIKSEKQLFCGYANFGLPLIALIGITIDTCQWCKQCQEVKTVDIELNELDGSSQDFNSAVPALEASE